jgi:hypothetical protein
VHRQSPHYASFYVFCIKNTKERQSAKKGKSTFEIGKSRSETLKHHVTLHMTLTFLQMPLSVFCGLMQQVLGTTLVASFIL